MIESEYILEDSTEGRSKVSRGESLKDFLILWEFIRPFSKPLPICFLFFFIDLAANLYLPRLMGIIVDQGLTGEYSFYLLIFIFFSLIAIMIVFNVLQKNIFIRVGENSLRYLRQEVYLLLQRIPLKFFDSNSSGKIISRTVNDISNISILFNAKFFSLLSDFVIVIGAIVSITLISPKFGLIIFLVMFFLSTFLYFFMGSYSGRLYKFRSMNSNLNSFMADTMNGLEIICAAQYHDFWIPRARKMVNLFKTTAEKSILDWAKFPMAHTSAMGISYGLFFLVCGEDLKTGKLSGGELLSVLTYILYAFNPFFEIGQKISEFQTAMTSMTKVNQILKLKTNLEEDHLKGKELVNSAGDIKFQDLTFSYSEDVKLFKNLTVNLPGKKITAIIGRTGSGKSSFISLISRLYPYSSGGIFIDRQEIREISKESLYSNLGIVTQQLFIFEDTLRENLRLYDERINDEKIWETLHQVNLGNKISALNKGLDFVYFKNEDPFSMGERQLLVMARMLLKDPKILIFDEATASLDNHSEFLVQSAMKQLFANRTVIIIAHRLSTIELANHVLVLESGEIVEEGDPKTLKKSNGAYASYLRHIEKSG